MLGGTAYNYSDHAGHDCADELKAHRDRLQCALEEIVNTTPSDTAAWRIANRTIS